MLGLRIEQRVQGSHHIFTRQAVEEILNLQQGVIMAIETRLALTHPLHLSWYHSPLGCYLLVSSQRGLVYLGPEEEGEAHIAQWQEVGASPPTADRNDHNDQAVRELDDYFAGRRREFTVPLDLRGTVFQRQVWQELRTIPYGETRSYSDVARAIERPAARRAVGAANGRNPISIIVPCHRVIGANGDLVGYGGGLERKEALLALEAEVLRGQSIRS